MTDTVGWFDESYPPSVLFPTPPPVTPTGATPGQPGSWTPPGSDAPDTLAEANGLGLSLGAAWAVVGDFVPLEGGAPIHWTGTAFATGAVPAAVPARRRRTTTDDEPATTDEPEADT